MTPTRLALALLGGALLLSVLAISALAWAERAIPDVLQVLASSSLTGILGVLVPRPTGQEDFR